MAISKLKSTLRKLAADCQSYFRACGYDPAELTAFDTT
jgi:hypothetical protein